MGRVSNPNTRSSHSAFVRRRALRVSSSLRSFRSLGHHECNARWKTFGIFRYHIDILRVSSNFGHQVCCKSAAVLVVSEAYFQSEAFWGIIGIIRGGMIGMFRFLRSFGHL